MASKISPEQKSAIKEGIKVFLWAGLSAVLPLVLAFVEKDPKWAILAPVINAIAYSVKVARDNKK